MNVADYTSAVGAYRRTFPNKQQQIEQTPDPAVREMLLNMERRGIETVFDRFDSQQPQCVFGMAGICCKNCFMGPCKITKRSPRGVCGADADLIVARNLLRHLASGTAAHGARGRESMLALLLAAQHKVDLPILGEQKVRATAAKFGFDPSLPLDELAEKVATYLLEDLSRTVPSEHHAIAAFAPKERLETWKKLGILPIGTYHEVFESLHRTTTGTDGDWKNVMKQFLRTGVAFAWSSCLGSSIAMDSLFGLPVRAKTRVNVGVLRKDTVNVAVHGHSPLLVSEIVRLGRSPEWQAKARAAGAAGMEFYGICCSGLSAMYRDYGVVPLANAAGAELVLGTGALDLWVADVQDVFPTIMNVAKCFKTAVITTSDSARLPDAEHYELKHDHSNISEIHELAEKILTRAIAAHFEREGVPRSIPDYEVQAEIGFSVEFIDQFYTIAGLADAIKDGRVRGIVNLVGCSNPRQIYEKAIVTVASELISHNILVLTNGCASFPLLKLGYCSEKALEYTGDTLKEFLRGLPPVWHMGECLDNARASGLFSALSQRLGEPLKRLPFAFSSPEWSNEKGLCAALAFRLLGLNSYHCVYAPVQGSVNVERFMATGTKEILGSEMKVDTDAGKLAAEIIKDIEDRRRELGWN